MPEVKEKSPSGAAKVAAFLKDRPARTGAELVKALRLSGTPDARLAGARKLLEDACDADGPQPSASQVLAAMEAEGVSPGTLAKARTLVAAGKVRPPAVAAPAVEDLILAEAEPKAAQPKK